ncbi:CBO0543 family protein [Heyndrickxia sp. MSNUG]|uniref:CBO0543 family protein n=1 Tax=Heyndrickxia sp. MSNUG TaxID=3136677 RepID=UPI003C2ACE04
MRLIMWLIWGLAAWKWGDWRNWKKYQATILYMMYFSAVYEILCYNFPIWRFEYDRSVPFLVNHPLTPIAISLILYPSIILIFLGRYPNGSWKKKLGWQILFVFLFSLSEFIIFKSGKITYHNGWISDGASSLILTPSSCSTFTTNGHY